MTLPLLRYLTIVLISKMSVVRFGLDPPTGPDIRIHADKPCRRDGSEDLIIRKRAEISFLDAQNGRQMARHHCQTERIPTYLDLRQIKSGCASITDKD